MAAIRSRVVVVEVEGVLDQVRDAFDVEGIAPDRLVELLSGAGELTQDQHSVPFPAA